MTKSNLNHKGLWPRSGTWVPVGPKASPPLTDLPRPGTLQVAVSWALRVRSTDLGGLPGILPSDGRGVMQAASPPGATLGEPHGPHHAATTAPGVARAAGEVTRTRTTVDPAPAGWHLPQVVPVASGAAQWSRA